MGEGLRMENAPPAQGVALAGGARSGALPARLVAPAGRATANITHEPDPLLKNFSR